MGNYRRAVFYNVIYKKVIDKYDLDNLASNFNDSSKIILKKLMITFQ